MAKGHKSIGHLLLKLGLAAYFIVTALCLFGIGASIKSAQYAGVIKSVCGGGTMGDIVQIVIAVFMIIAGVFFAIDIFKDLGKWDNKVMLCATIVWIVFAIIVDIISSTWGVKLIGSSPLTWVLNVAKDLLIIGAIQSIRD